MKINKSSKKMSNSFRVLACSAFCQLAGAVRVGVRMEGLDVTSLDPDTLALQNVMSSAEWDEFSGPEGLLQIFMSGQICAEEWSGIVQAMRNDRLSQARDAAKQFARDTRQPWPEIEFTLDASNPAGRPGYLNLGNSCWLNSLTQCFTRLRWVRVQEDEGCSCDGSEEGRKRCAACVLQGLIESQDSGAAAKNRALMNPFAVDKDDSQDVFYDMGFPNSIQLHAGTDETPDVQELLVNFTGILCKNRPDFRRLFFYDGTDEKNCNLCEATSVTPLLQEITMLPVRDQKASVQELFDQYFSQENMDEENRVECPTCSGLHTGTKRLSFRQPGKVLPILLNRARMDGDKWDTDIEVLPTLKVDARHRSQGNEGMSDVDYQLSSVIFHTGKHYYAYAKDADGSWWYYNDREVRPSSFEEATQPRIDTRTSGEKVNAAQPYLLFYEMDQRSANVWFGEGRAFRYDLRADIEKRVMEVAPAAAAPWACGDCTYLNQAHCAACEICGAAQPPLDPAHEQLVDPAHEQLVPRDLVQPKIDLVLEAKADADVQNDADAFWLEVKKEIDAIRARSEFSDENANGKETFSVRALGVGTLCEKQAFGGLGLEHYAVRQFAVLDLVVDKWRVSEPNADFQLDICDPAYNAVDIAALRQFGFVAHPIGKLEKDPLGDSLFTLFFAPGTGNFTSPPAAIFEHIADKMGGNCALFGTDVRKIGRIIPNNSYCPACPTLEKTRGFFDIREIAMKGNLKQFRFHVAKPDQMQQLREVIRDCKASDQEHLPVQQAPAPPAPPSPDVASQVSTDHRTLIRIDDVQDQIIAQLINLCGSMGVTVTQKVAKQAIEFNDVRDGLGGAINWVFGHPNGVPSAAEKREVAERAAAAAAELERERAAAEEAERELERQRAAERAAAEKAAIFDAMQKEVIALHDKFPDNTPDYIAGRFFEEMQQGNNSLEQAKAVVQEELARVVELKKQQQQQPADGLPWEKLTEEEKVKLLIEITHCGEEVAREANGNNSNLNGAVEYIYRKSPWTCATCTFENAADAKVCEICETAKASQ